MVLNKRDWYKIEWNMRVNLKLNLPSSKALSYVIERCDAGDETRCLIY